MCEQCGCLPFIQQGTEARLKQAIAVIRELGVTSENVQRFEDGERICNLVIASKVLRSEDEEVHEIAEWVLSLHQNIYAERSRSYAKTAREIFASFPAKGSAKEVITAWHQLEEILRGLGDEAIASVGDSEVEDIMRAVQHVHDNPKARLADLLRRYDLEGL